MTERELTKCPTCKTRTLHREGEELVCSECKGRFPAPAQSPGRHPKQSHARHYMSPSQVQERHRYYEENKGAILADIEAIGATATGEKWKIPGGTLSTLRHRWQKNPKSNIKTAWDKHEYYEKHKEEILHDLKVLGRKTTKEKWKLAASTLVTLLTRWRVPLEERVAPNGWLPQLPEFSNTWEPEVQVKWLEIYGKLYVKDSK